MSGKSVRVDLNDSDELNMATGAWLVWRICGRRSEWVGLVRSRRSPRKKRRTDVLAAHDWQIVALGRVEGRSIRIDYRFAIPECPVSVRLQMHSRKTMNYQPRRKIR